MGSYPWFLPVCLFLVYRKGTDFCMLIDCPALFLNVFIICKSFLVEYLRSLRYRIISSGITDAFCSSCLCWLVIFSINDNGLSLLYIVFIMVTYVPFP